MAGMFPCRLVTLASLTLALAGSLVITIPARQTPR